MKDVILNHLIKDNVRRRRGPRPSNAGSCPRKIYYDWNGEAEPAYREEMALAPIVGSGVHKILSSVLPASYLKDQPIKIQCNGFTIEGEFDALDLNTNQMIDFKVATHNTWAAVKNKPKAEHKEQVNLYAYGAGATSCKLVYFNCHMLSGIEAKRSKGKWTFERAVRSLNCRIHEWETDELMALSTIGHFEAVYANVVRKEPPARPFSHGDRFPCSWCEYYTECWSV